MWTRFEIQYKINENRFFIIFWTLYSWNSKFYHKTEFWPFLLIIGAQIYFLWRRWLAYYPCEKIFRLVQRGSNHSPFALGASIIPSWPPSSPKFQLNILLYCYIQCTLNSNGLDDIGKNGNQLLHKIFREFGRKIDFNFVFCYRGPYNVLHKQYITHLWCIKIQNRKL